MFFKWSACMGLVTNVSTVPCLSELYDLYCVDVCRNTKIKQRNSTVFVYNAFFIFFTRTYSACIHIVLARIQAMKDRPRKKQDPIHKNKTKWHTKKCIMNIYSCAQWSQNKNCRGSLLYNLLIKIY